jgi:hypothetical protein
VIPGARDESMELRNPAFRPTTEAWLTVYWSPGLTAAQRLWVRDFIGHPALQPPKDFGSVTLEWL